MDGFWTMYSSNIEKFIEIPSIGNLWYASYIRMMMPRIVDATCAWWSCNLWAKFHLFILQNSINQTRPKSCFYSYQLSRRGGEWKPHSALYWLTYLVYLPSETKQLTTGFQQFGKEDLLVQLSTSGGGILFGIQTEISTGVLTQAWSRPFSLMP